MADGIVPFKIEVPGAELDDLRDRLRRTRWPERETVADWSQRVPLAYLQELCGYWADGYDWRAAESRLNALSQFRTEIGGLGIHFIQVRSPEPDAPGCPGIWVALGGLVARMPGIWGGAGRPGRPRP